MVGLADHQVRSEVQLRLQVCTAAGYVSGGLSDDAVAHVTQPSAGLIPLDGVIEGSKWADTAGVLARDPKLFTSLLRAW